MLSSQMTSEVFARLLTIPDNKACFDCSSASISSASISHGVFLCSQCAFFHQQSLSHISLVKTLYTENWTENELNHMIYGGNIRFRNFIDIYKFPKDTPPETRYRTVASEFYREMLRNQVFRNITGEPPSIEEGRRVMIAGTGKTGKLQDLEEKNEEIVDKTFDMFSKVASFTREKVKALGEKLRDPALKEEVKEYGNKVGKMGKEFGIKTYSFIKEKIGENENKDGKCEKIRVNDGLGDEERKAEFIEKREGFEEKPQGFKEKSQGFEGLQREQKVNDFQPANSANFHENVKDFHGKNRENDEILDSENEFLKPRKAPGFDLNEYNENEHVFPEYQSTFSSDSRPYQYPNPNDKLDMAMDYIDKGFDRVVRYNYSEKFKAFGSSVMSLSKKTYGKVQEKWQDPEFQDNLKEKKASFVSKTKELGEKTGIFAKNLFENLKKKI